MQKKYEEYKELVYELKEKRKTLETENIKNLENSTNFDEDLTCIICYKQIADHRIKPCMHKGCQECLLTYMSDKSKCFMCRRPIESIQKIPKEEMEKIKNKEDKKEKDNNNKIIENQIKNNKDNNQEESISGNHHNNIRIDDDFDEEW